MTAVIKVDDVVKEFSLRSTHTLKDRLVWSLTGRRAQLVNKFRALDGVSFTVNKGDSIGLIGFNGSGKSTMLKLISGVMQPDAGGVQVRGRMAGLIEVGAGFHPDLTGKENVFLNGAILGMSREDIENAFDDIVAFSEIDKFIDTEVKFYSSGMFLRLAFSVAVHTYPDVFLIDEILAVGDEPFQRKCLDRIGQLQELGTSLVIVSHDLDMIKRLCNRGVMLERGKLIVDGTASEAVDRLREG
ncbi:ABC transporter ATP-binding protein [Buchananella hordeovulneris]|uniref:ABC transporter ATP-binding protein n=1 Tax=Buchananella hordeovulneris TaxID=52770 RepID=A0A1Q5PWG7_9ACTO|nr:ABC transporter ATP-binding protein [Buchananella hordeovulneris]MDO5079796.1 ABC transporter ATP-binding protein [Buchananella hordeovulneris]OKL51846.1 ABC transporter ATP-binding protein [Buchananella hordeovulneris]RRD44527.1 ABC transporter ATP-binding protein [Buchananella hordeovulneris]RRD51691.1 ABC transporter ATP-binding protein [Buchananella hordeovulneris]